jgi:hypothetical protein
MQNCFSQSIKFARHDTWFLFRAARTEQNRPEQPTRPAGPSSIPRDQPAGALFSFLINIGC